MRLLRVIVALAGVLAGQAVLAGTHYDIKGYGGPWATLHHDNRNSNYAPVPIAERYEVAYQQGGVGRTLTFNRPVIGPEGNVYFTYKHPARDNSMGYLIGYRGKDGRQVLNVKPPDLDGGVAAGNALVDAKGMLYVADSRSLSKLTPRGELRWRIPVNGAGPTAPQFTPDGKILLMTSTAWVYVVEPASGTVLLELNLTPDRVYPEPDPGGILDGDTPAYAFVNMPAVDPTRSLIYQTFAPADPGRPTEVHAYRYALHPRRLTLAWRNAALEGGSGTTIAVSADYRHLYVNDRSDHLIALNTADGTLAWQRDVGYTSISAPLVTPGGLVVPGGNSRDPGYRFMVLADRGDRAEPVFELAGYRPLSTAAAGLDNRFVIVAQDQTSGAVELLVLHPRQGVLSRTPWGDGAMPERLIGIALDHDGWLYVNSWDGAVLQVFRPLAGG